MPWAIASAAASNTPGAGTEMMLAVARVVLPRLDNGVVDRHAVNGLAALARRDAGDDARAIREHVLRHGGSFSPSDALH